MGHLIFIFLHLIAVIFTWGAALLLTVPLHLIYAAVRSRRRGVEAAIRKLVPPAVIGLQTPSPGAIEAAKSGPKATTSIPGTCRVVVEGSTLPGFAPDDVRRRLAALIGRSDDVATELLGGRPSMVKRGIDEATGMRYVETLKKIGVACHLEQETLELDLNERGGTAFVIAEDRFPVRKGGVVAADRPPVGKGKPLFWVIGIVVALGILSIVLRVTNEPSSPDRQAKNTTLTPAQQAQQDRDRQREAQIEERKKRFAPQRDALIAKAKQLNAAGKYQDALDLGSQWLSLDPELDSQSDIAREKAAAQTERAERVRKKKEGVSLGMTKQEVLESSWGKPQSINSTHTAAGTHEQWVYPGRSYLYFDDGVLTRVQN